jgi:hypothetical protein
MTVYHYVTVTKIRIAKQLGLAASMLNSTAAKKGKSESKLTSVASPPRKGRWYEKLLFMSLRASC